MDNETNAALITPNFFLRLCAVPLTHVTADYNTSC